MLILASTSPRRKELLQNLKLPFKIVASEYQEDHSLALSPGSLVRLFARKKAENVAIRYSDDVVIGADTLVVLGTKALGKPHTHEEARKMLKKISGKEVSVLTGLTVMCHRKKKTISRLVKAKIKVKKITAEEIENYVKTGEPLDKAGGFGIQSLGTVLIEEIHGDYFAIVGLPLFALSQMLKNFGIHVL